MRDQRVAEIVRRKLTLAWGPGSAKKLAAEWGVTVDYVHELATDANKKVRASATDPDDIAAELLPTLRATYRAAAKQVRRGKGSLGDKAKMTASVASMGTLLADIAGLKAPKQTKNEHSGPGGGPMQVNGPLIFIPPETDE